MLDYVENTVTGQQNPMSKYDYTTDDIGRRTRVDYSGDAFTAAHYYAHLYNDRNELTSARYYDTGDNENNGHKRLFTYDPIGNRKDHTEGTSVGAQKFYCANDLNQYLTLDEVSGCPATSPIEEEFAYDTDGNLTQDGTYTYTWDGENRLRAVYPTNAVNDDKMLVFDYDYMSRRVRKRIFLYNNGWPELTSTPDTDLKFVYDQWNVVMVLNGKASDAIQSKYTWGLDMSGLAGSGVAPGVSPVVSGIHGAGGIGGLIAGEEMSGTHQGSYWYLYDGNGNVGQILKYEADSPPTISTAACYEYDPYGNIIGPDTDNDGDWQDDATAYALANPLRFSTKWFDNESGLGYWGYRYYSLRLGRWMSRDPNEEAGSVLVRQAKRLVTSFIFPDTLNAGELHLYGFARNDPANKVDVLGLYYGGGGDKKERWNCLCNCGYSKCNKGSQNAQEALKAAKERFNPEELHNGKGDAWRHCFWNCKMVCDIGQKCAKLIADQHEEAGSRANQPKEEADMDYHNNHVGRSVAQEYACDCFKGCDEALANGRLVTLK